MLRHLGNRIYSGFTKVYCVSGIPRTSSSHCQAHELWVLPLSSCLHVPTMSPPWKCEFHPNYNELGILCPKRNYCADYFSLLQWYETGCLTILSAFLPVESAFLQSGISPTECSHRNVEHSCSWQDKISVKVNVLCVFIDMCSKNWTSAGPLRATTKNKA